MKRMIGLVAVLFFCTATVFAQPKIEWQRCLGGTRSDDAGQVLPTNDGGCIVIASSLSSDGDRKDTLGKSDIWVVKLSNQGTIEWEKSYGGRSDDGGSSIAGTFDGGYIVAGWSRSSEAENGFHGDADVFIFKIDSFGKLQWQRCYGGSDYDGASRIIQSKDSSFVFCGQTSSSDGDIKGKTDSGVSGWIVKLSQTGAILWQNCVGGSGSENLNSIIQTTERAYVACGTTTSNDLPGFQGKFDILIVAIDTGIVLWQTVIGGPGYDYGSQILQTADSGYILCGTTTQSNSPFWNTNGVEGMLVVKLRANRSIDWSWCYGGSSAEEGYCIAAITDSTFYVAGRTTSPEMLGNHNPSSGDAWILQIGPHGTMLAEKCLGSSANDWLDGAAITSDNQLIVIGGTGLSDGDVSGFHGPQGGADIWVVKLKNEANGVERNAAVSSSISFTNPVKNTVLLNYTNYTSSLTTITLLNLLGQAVLETTDQNTSIGQRQLTLEVSALITGTYIMKVRSGEEVAIRKVVKY